MSAQLAWREGRLLEARRDMVECWSSACPAPIQADCAEWHAEVQRSIPAIVIGARSAAGDEVNVEVTMDGKLLTTRLDGNAIEVEPGEHEFQFKRAGFPLVRRTLVIRAGEKNRPLLITFDNPESRAPGTAPSASAPEQPNQAYRPIPALTYALAGTAIVALASFAYFGSQGLNKKDELDRCKPFCEESDVQSVQTRYLIANVSLGVGVLASSGALITYLTRPAVSVTGARVPASSGASLVLGGRF